VKYWFFSWLGRSSLGFPTLSHPSTCHDSSDHSSVLANKIVSNICFSLRLLFLVWGQLWHFPMFTLHPDKEGFIKNIIVQVEQRFKVSNVVSFYGRSLTIKPQFFDWFWGFFLGNHKLATTLCYFYVNQLSFQHPFLFLKLFFWWITSTSDSFGINF